MSSISRARSSASARAAAGECTISGGSPGFGVSRSAHLSTSCASNSRRSSPPNASGSSSALALPAVSEKASSSSSMSPSGTIRGSTAASSPSTSRKISRASAHTRRVGRNSVARASAGGSAERESRRSARRLSARRSVSAETAPTPGCEDMGVSGHGPVIGMPRRVVIADRCVLHLSAFCRVITRRFPKWPFPRP